MKSRTCKAELSEIQAALKLSALHLTSLPTQEHQGSISGLPFLPASSWVLLLLGASW